MEASFVKDYFEKAGVVDDYAFAVDRVGLWESERLIIATYLQKSSKILELGCGSGRISINLARLGYESLEASDFSQNMVDSAKNLGEYYNLPVNFRVEDATLIADRQDSSFDGVIFGFNGLMQIPKRENRLKCLKRVRQILKAGGIFIFTTHDRDVARNKEYWDKEKELWQSQKMSSALDEFGDKTYESEHGKLFIHSPAETEILEDIATTNFKLEMNTWRSLIAVENEAVREFSDDCRFWVVSKQI
ncbi:MAG: class I SAM-dependent methyltransferase [Opitutales bacterium]